MNILFLGMTERTVKTAVMPDVGNVKYRLYLRKSLVCRVAIDSILDYVTGVEICIFSGIRVI